MPFPLTIFTEKLGRIMRLLNQQIAAVERKAPVKYELLVNLSTFDEEMTAYRAKNPKK